MTVTQTGEPPAARRYQDAEATGAACNYVEARKTRMADRFNFSRLLSRSRAAAVIVQGFVAEFHELLRIRKQRKQLVAMSDEAGQVTTFVNFVENQLAVSRAWVRSQNGPSRRDKVESSSNAWSCVVLALSLRERKRHRLYSVDREGRRLDET